MMNYLLLYQLSLGEQKFDELSSIEDMGYISYT